MTFDDYKGLDSPMVQHAIRELQLLDPDLEPSLMLGILEIVRVFAEMGHSGCSAQWCIGVIDRLLQFKPLTPLTGDDSEWGDVGEGLLQNMRHHSVFKENGDCYNVEGKVFSDDGGKTWFFSAKSRTPVTFPYTPGEPERVILAGPVDGVNL